MVDVQGQIVPTTGPEWALLKALYEVTGDAREAGVDPEEIVVTLNFVALSILAFDDAEGPDIPEGPVHQRAEDCPECGDPIEEVTFFVGGDGEVNPCGCLIQSDQLPGWVGDG